MDAHVLSQFKDILGLLRHAGLEVVLLSQAPARGSVGEQELRHLQIIADQSEVEGRLLEGVLSVDVGIVVEQNFDHFSVPALNG